MADVAEHGWLQRALWVGLERAPQSAEGLIHRVHAGVVAPAANFRLPLVRLQGSARDGGTGSLLLAARGPGATALARRFFVAPPRRTELGSVTLPGLRRALLTHGREADLVLALVPKVAAGWLAGADLLRVPQHVELVLDGAALAGLPGANATTRRRIRQIRCSPLRARVSHDPADFDRFHDGFHLPMIAQRFGDLAVHQARRALRRRFRFGGILWIELDGVPLAGNLFELSSERYRMVTRGRRCEGLDDPQLARLIDGAGYLFSFELAQRLGAKEVSLGATAPTAGDGLYLHKRAWGAAIRPRADARLELLVGWQAWSPRLAAWLSTTPLVVRVGGGLVLLAAPGDGAAPEPQEAARLWRRLAMPGLRRLHLVAAEVSPAEAGAAAPPPGRVLVWPAEAALAARPRPAVSPRPSAGTPAAAR
jgi:hypothetical protein